MLTMKMRFKVYEREAAAAVREATIDPLNKAGLLVEADAKRSMKKGGRYTGPRGGKGQTPSAPGTPPHRQSGTLISSVTHGFDKRSVTMLVGATAPYGKVHEKGGEWGGRNYPRRAFMRPALNRMMSRFRSLFRNLPVGTTPSGRGLNRRKGR